MAITRRAPKAGLLSCTAALARTALPLCAAVFARAAGPFCAAVFARAAVVVAAVALAAGCAANDQTPLSAAGPRTSDQSTDPPATKATVDDATLKKLPETTTFTSVHGLPLDTGKNGTLDGAVVHPPRTVAIYATPGGEPVARLPAEQLGGPTWVPMTAERDGWVRVLLPSRPNNVTGWIVDKDLSKARSSYTATVELGKRRLTVRDSGKEVGTWIVAIGGKATPTPVGRTFVLALLAPANPTYSPLILPLGAHSETLDSFGGGPGTVAFHGWPDASVFGKAVTHGCVRVPPQALKVLTELPLGSPVLIKP